MIRRVNATHPLAQGLRYAWVFDQGCGSSVREIVTGKLCPISNMTWVGTKWGGGLHWVSATSRVTCGTRCYPRWDANGYAIDSLAVAIGFRSENPNSFQSFCGNNYYSLVTQNSAQLGTYDLSGAGGSGADMYIKLNADQVGVWVFTQGEVGAYHHITRYYLDGRKTGPDMGGAGPYKGFDSTFQIGNDGWNEVFTGTISFVYLYLWQGAAPGDPFWRDLSNDPLAIFEPVLTRAVLMASLPVVPSIFDPYYCRMRAA